MHYSPPALVVSELSDHDMYVERVVRYIHMRGSYHIDQFFFDIYYHTFDFRFTVGIYYNGKFVFYVGMNDTIVSLIQNSECTIVDS